MSEFRPQAVLRNMDKVLYVPEHVLYPALTEVPSSYEERQVLMGAAHSMLDGARNQDLFDNWQVNYPLRTEDSDAALFKLEESVRPASVSTVLVSKTGGVGSPFKLQHEHVAIYEQFYLIDRFVTLLTSQAMTTSAVQMRFQNFAAETEFIDKIELSKPTAAEWIDCVIRPIALKRRSLPSAGRKAPRRRLLG